MQIESCGHPQALSTAGAIGLFQVMPYHFSNDDDPYKPNINARRGLTYFQQALTAGDGDIRLAFAGYNGGINGARSPESNWPAETLRFVYWGKQIYEDASKGKTQSDRLDEWLTAGGASLCEAASIKLGLNE
jgi:soluble lytic murein transglycosylase-like protein